MASLPEINLRTSLLAPTPLLLPKTKSKSLPSTSASASEELPAGISSEDINDALVNERDAQQPLHPQNLIVTGGLGLGGFGIVVEVGALSSSSSSLSVDPHDRFAMKCLPKSRYRRAKDRQGLGLELSILTMRKPSRFLLSCQLAFETPSHIFLVTDILSGGDLFFRLDQTIDQGREGLEEDQARTILAEVSLGLIHLHRCGFVHRDIKIENVMIANDGHAKIIDFGLAAKIPADETTMRMKPDSTTICMAPEVFTKNIGGRFTDWWAMGILGYELLTGRSPWSSLTDIAQLTAEITTSTVYPPQGVSESASRFISGLLQKSVNDRLGTRSDADVLVASFFSKVDWEATRRGEGPPAFIPRQGEVTIFAEDAQAAIESYYGEVANLEQKQRPVYLRLDLVQAVRAPPVKLNKTAVVGVLVRRRSSWKQRRREAVETHRRAALVVLRAVMRLGLLHRPKLLNGGVAAAESN